MFHIILLDPEIPPNTGNVIRLAANAGAVLHIAGAPGFSMDDKNLRRAGLDYREYASVRAHPSLDAAFESAGTGRRFAASSAGETRYDAPRYLPGDIFLFGRESTGLSPEALDQFEPGRRLFIPMRPNNRSMNLSNAVAVIIMEAWRQINFRGAGRA